MVILQKKFHRLAWENFCAEIDALDWQSSQAALQAVIDNAR